MNQERTESLILSRAGDDQPGIINLISCHGPVGILTLVEWWQALNRNLSRYHELTNHFLYQTETLWCLEWIVLSSHTLIVISRMQPSVRLHCLLCSKWYKTISYGRMFVIQPPAPSIPTPPPASSQLQYALCKQRENTTCVAAGWPEWCQGRGAASSM